MLGASVVELLGANPDAAFQHGPKLVAALRHRGASKDLLATVTNAVADAALSTAPSAPAAFPGSSSSSSSFSSSFVKGVSATQSDQSLREMTSLVFGGGSGVVCGARRHKANFAAACAKGLPPARAVVVLKALPRPGNWGDAEEVKGTALTLLPKDSAVAMSHGPGIVSHFRALGAPRAFVATLIDAVADAALSSHNLSSPTVAKSLAGMLFGEIGDNQEEEEAARSRYRGRFAEWCIKKNASIPSNLAMLLQTMVPSNIGQQRAISKAHRDAIAVVADAVFAKSGHLPSATVRAAFRLLMDCPAATAFRPTLERFAAAPMNATQATSVLEDILTDSKARADASGPNAPIIESLVRRKLAHTSIYLCCGASFCLSSY